MEISQDLNSSLFTKEEIFDAIPDKLEFTETF
jgi:hypothetical protein